MKFNKKYTRDVIWGLSILFFVACCVMAFWLGSIPFCIAAAVFATIWVKLSFEDYRENENHLKDQQNRMHL